MPHRSIVDAEGVEWKIWDVHPTLEERRRMTDRRKQSRGSPDRRRMHSNAPSFLIGDSWLAFVSDFERRRLMLVPVGWHELPDEDLLLLLDRASESARPRGGR